jgi:ABC-type transport system involved in cytochrome c biogenesis permease subunit
VTTDAIIRVVAVLAAVGVVAGPSLAALASKVKTHWENRQVETGAEKVAAVTGKDLHIVLDLATRLKAAGCMAGVALCQELIDVMLGNAKAKK